jgi:hypothetical protein
MPSRVPEPNNMSKGLELCAVANASQAYAGVWGWADAPCALRLPSVCERRE